MLTRSDSWDLTVHFWPGAVEAGVNPCRVLMFQFDEKDWKPNFYHSHTINFKNPPSREDFLYVVNGTYWMHNNWKDRLLPLIEKGDWPMVYKHWEKAASADILDGQGRRVGRLDVQRQDTWVNANYECPPVSSDDRDVVLRGMRGPTLLAAQNAVLIGGIKNRVRETLSLCEEGFCDADVHRELRKALVEAGLMKPKKAAKPKGLCELQAA
jgi:hypothetical protein